MIQVNWEDRLLDVHRLVFRRGHELAFDIVLDRLAARFNLEITDDLADPLPGDFWIGCSPRAGWGDAHDRIGWAIPVEVPLAIGILHGTVKEHRSHVDETVPNTVI